MCACIEKIMHLQNENSKFNIDYLYQILQKFDYNILFLLVKGVSGEKRIHFTAKLAPACIIWTNTQLTKSLEDLSDRIIIHYLHLPQISSNHTIQQTAISFLHYQYKRGYVFINNVISYKHKYDKQTKLHLKGAFVNTDILCTILEVPKHV